MGQAEESTEYFIKSFQTDPKSINQGIWVSWSYFLQRKWKEAEEWIDIYISTRPEHSLGYYRKSLIYIYGYGNPEEAKEILTEGANNIPNFYQSYYLWLIELYAHNYQLALDIAESDTWRPHYNYLYRGQILDVMGEHQKAISCYDSARILLEELIIESPENALHHSFLGLVYAGLGNKAEAIRFGKKAIDLHPIHSDPYSSGEEILLDFAVIEITLGEFEEAINHIETLLSIPSQVTMWRLKLDPKYNPLRTHPRFQKILENKN